MTCAVQSSPRAAGAGLTVVSQLGEALDTALLKRVSDLQIISVPRGFPAEIPNGATVWFAAPVHGLRERAPIPRPAAWPHDLRWIQLVSAGADGYPNWVFDGVPVSCARGPSAAPMAEYTIAAIFAAAKSLPDLWVRDAAAWRMRRLGSVAGATLGIFGFGAVGRAIAQRALAMGMHVVASRARDAPLGMDGVAQVHGLAPLLAMADHLVVAVPNTVSTRGLLNAAALAGAKPGLHLINIARGAIVETEALLPALESGLLSRVTLDTTDPEPLPEGHALYSHPRAFISPHIAMLTAPVMETLADKFAANLALFRAGRTPSDLVDPQRGY